MSQLPQKSSETDWNELLQTVLSCISDTEAKIQDAINSQKHREDIGGWLEAQHSLDEAKQKLEGLAVLSEGSPVRKQDKQDRARLASFPEYNPNIVLEINLEGQLTYINPSARNHFPDLEEKGIDHPFLAGWIDITEKVRKGAVLDIIREVKIEERYYEQSVYFVKEYCCVRVYGLEITDRKKTEHALKRAHEELEKRVQERTQELKIANVDLKNEIETRKSTERQLRESEASLVQALNQEKIMQSQLIQAEKNSALARMVGSVAHEINNPIQTINNCLFILQGEINPASEADEILKMAVSEARRIGDLVGRLRELYKPSKDSTPKRINVIKILNEVGALLVPHLQQHQVQWSMNTDAEMVWVNGISDQLKQVCLNLCLNAVDAMENKGGTVSVVVTTSDPSLVCISLQDNGNGILPENMPKIFEPFFTTKEKGSGLGLSICHEIVKNFNGNITVESQPGHGTKFSVYLPSA